MKQVLFASFALFIVITGCSKSDSGGSGSVPDKYMNTNAGSTWNYEAVDSTPTPIVVTPYTVTSTNRDTTVNGKSYHVYTNSTGATNEYYNITGNNYYSFRALPAFLGGASKEILYLKDNVSVGGASWEAVRVDVASPLGPIQVIFTNAVTAKGITKVVNGITYTNVIQVTTTLSTIPGLPSGSFNTNIQAFYAPKHGLIQSTNKINSSLTTPPTSINQANNLKTSTLL